eukprot:scaffold665842_cov39-Prasinocladus_malaysianus.AAC.1
MECLLSGTGNSRGKCACRLVKQTCKRFLLNALSQGLVSQAELNMLAAIDERYQDSSTSEYSHPVFDGGGIVSQMLKYAGESGGRVDVFRQIPWNKDQIVWISAIPQERQIRLLRLVTFSDAAINEDSLCQATPYWRN